MNTLPLELVRNPPLPLWRQADDRWQVRSFGTGGLGGVLWGGALGLIGVWIGLGALRLVRSSSRGRTSRTRAQLWSARLALAGPVALRPHDEHALGFSLPADAPRTRLSGGETALYRELGVELALEGVDFRECYLVPVYHDPVSV